MGGIFDPEVDGSIGKIITTLVQGITGDSSVTGSVANFFSMIPQRVSDAASGLLDKLLTDVFDPVSNFFTGNDPTSLQGILNTAVMLALQGFGATVYGAVALPVINVINTMIEMVESGVKGFMTGVAGFVLSVADGLGGLVDTTAIRNVAADLNSKASSINFGRVSTELPAFLTPTPAATGGLFGSGLLKVGERGPELIGAADKIGVLPAGLTRALEGLSSIMAAPPPMQVAGNTTTNNSSSSFTFNGVQSDNDARRRYNALRAGMR
jgi:hypothetical protein